MRLPIAVLILLLACVGLAQYSSDVGTRSRLQSGDARRPARVSMEETARVPRWAYASAAQRREAKRLGIPVAFENRWGMRFILIPAGTATIGSPEDERDRDVDEVQHAIAIDRAFYMQVREVSLGQFRAMDPNHRVPRRRYRELPETSRDVPAGIDWNQARAFAAWLSTEDPERSYHLPREVQWEYACRAGTTSAWWWGDDPDGHRGRERLARAGTSRHRRVPVGACGSLEPNPWGLHDIAGNAAEWCRDRYGAYPDADGAARERSLEVLAMRPGAVVVRGGCAADPVIFARSAWRDALPPHGRRSGAPRLDTLSTRLVVPID